ncbi:cytospin-A isoform X2 [Polypterus senegalus]|uniref:cytospin-A isoform X2 n=1 Tax=Polypterus senegalus TaxID=55291 RepID=UPI001965346F|nr:cytospin-A isoform X2 [Polypterus senegalus]
MGNSSARETTSAAPDNHQTGDQGSVDHAAYVPHSFYSDQASSCSPVKPQEIDGRSSGKIMGPSPGALFSSTINVKSRKDSLPVHYCEDYPGSPETSIASVTDSTGSYSDECEPVQTGSWNGHHNAAGITKIFVPTGSKDSACISFQSSAELESSMAQNVTEDSTLDYTGEKDSGMDQSVLNDGSIIHWSEMNSSDQSIIKQKVKPESGVQDYWKNDWNASVVNADVVKSLLIERDGLLLEIKMLKQKMQVDQEEWRQFQSDLQVAVSVADRIKCEAEDELAALRKKHNETNVELVSLHEEHSRIVKEMSELSISYQDKLKELLAAKESAKAFFALKISNQETEKELVTLRATHQKTVEELMRVTEKCHEMETELNEIRADRQERRSFSQVAKEARTVFSSNEYMESLKRLRTNATELPPSLQDSLMNGNSPHFVAAHSTMLVSTGQNDNRSWRMAKQIEYFNNNTALKKENSNPVHMDVVSVDRASSFRKDGMKDGISMHVKRHGSSRRNSLLHWCQSKTEGYKNIEITNFSSSWTDGLAFCAVYHTYLPSHINYSKLRPQDKKENLSLAFKTGERVGIPAKLTVDEMVKGEGPDWQRVLDYVESIYVHFET